LRPWEWPAYEQPYEQPWPEDQPIVLRINALRRWKRCA
jgi:hypothetical protein